MVPGCPVQVCFVCFAFLTGSAEPCQPGALGVPAAQQEDPCKAQESPQATDLILPPGSFLTIMHPFLVSSPWKDSLKNSHSFDS